MTPNDEPVLIVDIRRNALDDGPGIRTSVFFKGCPLRCTWCHNPEALAPRAELWRVASRCLDCGACRGACAAAIARPARQTQADDGCTLCGRCVDACAAGARRIAGREITVAALFDLLLADAPFYRHSGGGVTLTGGEPTRTPAAVGRLARELCAAGIHVLLETCGHFAWERVAAELLPHVATVYFDLKLASAVAHAQHCGVGNERIVENFRKLAASGRVELVPRIPLVPGITDGEENLVALAHLIRSAGRAAVVALPYNPLWRQKLPHRAEVAAAPGDSFMPATEVARCVGILRRAGLTVVEGAGPGPSPTGR